LLPKKYQPYLFSLLPVKYFCASLLFISLYQISWSQANLCKGSLGDPVVNITFGHGPNPGPPLSSVAKGASTTLTYIASSGTLPMPPPNDGEYSISNGVPANPTWFFRAPDHTATAWDGYMAIYNASADPGEFYKQTISTLCGSTTYEFAAWVANILDSNKRVENLHPDISFSIEQTDGIVLAKFDTGPIGQSNYMNWIQYGLYFTTPSGVETVVLRMVNNTPGGQGNLGNDIAIDDITFRPCGPTITGSFSNGAAVDTLTICQGSSIDLYGTASSGYVTPAYLWQFSADSGKSWTDIPSSNNLHLMVTPPATTKLTQFQYRMLTAESANIGSGSCRVASNRLTLIADPVPAARLTGINTCYGDPGKILFSEAIGISPFTISYSNSGNTYTKSGLANGDSFYIVIPVLDTSFFSLLTITDANGCANPAVAANSTPINMVPLPQGGITGGQGCEQDTARLIFHAIHGLPPFRITLTDGVSNFQVDGIPLNGTFSIPGQLNTNSKVYTLLSITDSNGVGCTRGNNFNSSTAALAVIPSPKVRFDSLTPICLDHTIFLITGAGDTSGIAGTGFFSGQGVSSGGSFDPAKVSAGIYPITYFFQANNGCADSVTKNQVVYTVPVANAGPDILACLNSNIQLNATGGSVYLWSPSRGLSDPSVQSPVATGISTITYSVEVTNNQGCSATDSMTVIISPLGKPAYTVPNVFTPNGDGKNDCFGFHWGGIELQEFSVYNRWGQMLFHSKDPSGCWDGTFRGVPQDSGGYVYAIRAITPCGNISLKGTVLLIR